MTAEDIHALNQMEASFDARVNAVSHRLEVLESQLNQALKEILRISKSLSERQGNR